LKAKVLMKGGGSEISQKTKGGGGGGEEKERDNQMVRVEYREQIFRLGRKEKEWVVVDRKANEKDPNGSKH